MWIQGRRRGGAKDLANHLKKTDENEFVAIRDIEGFTFSGLTGDNLQKAIKQMEAVGYGKGDKRNLYHAIFAPAYGEGLTAVERDFMVNYYAEHMGFKGHQYVVVEHWKKGKQHFHLVFNIIDPITGKTHELKWTKQKEWKISRGLEEILGLSTPKIKGKAARTWEMQRGKRTGIDPRKMRKEVTAIYHASKTTQEFIAALEKAGYTLTFGKRNQLVLIDKFGDTHGLMRRIEGKKLADLRQKFPGIGKAQLPSHDHIVKNRKPQKTEKVDNVYEAIDPSRVREDIQEAYRTSKTGVEFFAKLNRKEYSIGRGLKGFVFIDKNGTRHDLRDLLGKETVKNLGKKFSDLESIHPRPISEILRRLKATRSRNRTNYRRHRYLSSSAIIPILPVLPLKSQFRNTVQETGRTESNPVPVQPNKGWPEAAVIDWKAWGHKAPARFFAKWPELAPPGFSPMSGPRL